MVHNSAFTPNSIFFGQLFNTDVIEELKKGSSLPFSSNSESIIYIVDGYVAEQAIGGVNDLTTYAIYGPNDLILSSLLHQARENEPSYTAITDCNYVVRDAEMLFSSSERSGISHILVLKQLLHQLDLSYARTQTLALKYADDRVIYRLLFLADRFGKTNQSGSVKLQLPLTHRLLASTINLSRERVTKALRNLQAKGLISSRGKCIVIHNPQALLAAAKQQPHAALLESAPQPLSAAAVSP